MKTIALIIMVATLLEGLVEYAKTIMHMVEEGDIKTAVTQAITIIMGVCLAFVFKTQLFNMGLSEIYEGLSINPVIDTVLTGIVFSRGSNYVSDFIGKLKKPNISEGQLLAMYEDGLDDIEDYDEIEEMYDGIPDNGETETIL